MPTGRPSRAGTSNDSIARTKRVPATSWWLTTMPGLVVVVVVLAANRISRSLDGEWSKR